MIKIFVAGDILNYNKTDGEICSEGIEKIVKGCDYSICNLEAPVKNNGRIAYEIGTHHSQQVSTIKGLKKHGFDHLLLANNHILDYGIVGLEETIEEISRNNLLYIGVGNNFKEIYKPQIVEIKNLKIGMINASEAHYGVHDYNSRINKPGYAWINHSQINKSIIRIRDKCDYIILFAHAGLENYYIPQLEWRIRYKELCDLGVDIIVGSHPHVPQGYEYYNQSIIIYSLGNFYFDSKSSLDKQNKSYSVVLKLDEKGKIVIDPVYHEHIGDVVRLSNSKSIDLNRLNNLLTDSYIENNKSNCLDVYNKVLARHLKTYDRCNKPLEKIKKNIYDLLNFITRNKKTIDKDKITLHMLKNESYNYAIKNALEQIIEGNCYE